ncbi:MAG: zinc ABC transporter substrate-binding protein [Alphaproteobacteria bacterium]
MDFCQFRSKGAHISARMPGLILGFRPTPPVPFVFPVLVFSFFFLCGGTFFTPRAEAGDGIAAPATRASGALGALEVVESATGAPRVVATIFPLAAIAVAVMDGRGVPEVLLEAGVSPHGSQLRPSQARLVARADVVFALGRELEGRLLSAVENLTVGGAGGHLEILLADSNLVNLQRRLQPDGSLDPHIWLSAENVGVIALHMAETLARLDPQHGSEYHRRARVFAERARALEEEWRLRMRYYHGRDFVVHHDSLGYFTDSMGLNPLGALTHTPEVPAGAGHQHALMTRIAEVRREYEEHATQAQKQTSSAPLCFFVEPQLLLRSGVARGLGAQLGVVDPLGIGLALDSDTWFVLYGRLARTMADCLALIP